MGNCQAMEVATVVIQHPGGRVERLYWPANASEIMRGNPGHYVALVTQYSQEEKLQNEGSGSVRFTRVRLLRPKDTLVLGHVYRLVTSQEVTKGLQARWQEKMKSNIDLIEKQMHQQKQRTMIREQHLDAGKNETQTDSENTAQVAREGRNQQKPTQSVGRARPWRPSLQSILEAGS